MTYRLGLRLLNLLTPSPAPQAGPTPFIARPSGKLILLNVSDPVAMQSLLALVPRLIEELGASVLITSQSAGPFSCSDIALIEAIFVPGPRDSPLEVVAFLDHFHPDAILNIGDQLPPILIDTAANRTIPLFLLEAKAPRLLNSGFDWWPGLMRGLLARFRTIVALDGGALLSIRQAGGRGDSVQALGRMEEASPILPYDEKRRQNLAKILNTRPIWLAADIESSEEAAVISAHANALSVAHRLLLIIVPREAARVPALEALILSQKNWGVGLEARNELPNQEIEVLIAGPEAYGLWYRLSPITFLGGSLYGEGCARNPFEAAAMGSALMHGPRPGAFGTYLGRLGAARAAVAVSTGQDLHEALTDLLSPDRAALHAQAAWAVASNGVDVTDQVVEMVRSAIGEA